jgi:DNA polymerase III delta subunit
VSETPALAYLWGEDAFGIERAAIELERRLATGGEPLEHWRTSGDDDADDPEAGGSSAARRNRTLDQVEQHLAMAPLFGPGTLVVVRQPASLLAAAESRERLIGMLGVVAPGNALCFTDLVAAGARGPAARGILRDAVAAAGGWTQEFAVPAAGRMEPWLMDRARELGVTLEPAAARLLAERVGAHVREADVDRRRRTQLANAELEKLALYRPDGTIGAADVAELVSESIPGSMWAFLDAVGARSATLAAPLADRLLADGMPLPVLVSQVHRRLRDLVGVREHLDSGSRPADIVRDMRLAPYRAEKLAEQARTWSPAQLEAALADLLAVDMRGKGVTLDGTSVRVSAGHDGLAVQAWIAAHLLRNRSGGGVRPGTRSRAPA